MEVEASPVPEAAKRDASALGSCGQRKFAPAPIWTEAMLAALQNGVKGGKWHSLIDKVSRLDILKMGWAQVERNAGAAGVDRMTVKEVAKRFGISADVAYYWIGCGIIQPRQSDGHGRLWITLDAAKEQELRQRVLASSRIQKQHANI